MSEESMTVELKQVDGLTFVARADSGHWVVLDGPEAFGGNESGSKPLELLLMGLAGCTGMDVVSILKKKRVPMVDYQMEVNAVRATDHPRVFTKIELVYRIYGPVKSKDVERAIQLSQERYCAAMAMLKPVVPITSRYEIIE